MREHNRTGIYITQDVPEIVCLLFADDVAGFAEFAASLQRQLNIIDQFCRSTGMQLNLS